MKYLNTNISIFFLIITFSSFGETKTVQNSDGKALEMSIHDLRKKLMGIKGDSEKIKVLKKQAKNESVKAKLEKRNNSRFEIDKGKREKYLKARKNYVKKSTPLKGKTLTEKKISKPPRKPRVRSRNKVAEEQVKTWNQLKQQNKKTFKKNDNEKVEKQVALAKTGNERKVSFDIQDYAQSITNALQYNRDEVMKCSKLIDSSQKVLVSMVIKQSGEFDLSIDGNKSDPDFIHCLSTALGYGILPPHDSEKEILIKIPIYTGVKIL